MESQVTARELRFGGGRRAYVALPGGDGGPRPCVMLLHERYGVVKHTRDLTERLARAGYVAAAPDLFWRVADQSRLQDGTAQQPLTDPEVAEDLEATLVALGELPQADVGRLGIVGVCQTGRCPIVWGADHPLAACVVLYGAAQPQEWEANERQPVPLADLVPRLPCPLLGIFGEADHIISLDHVARLRSCLEAGRRSYHIRVFRAAPHGWLNDTMPGRYRREAAEEAWGLIAEFLAARFSGPAGGVAWRFDAGIGADYDFTRNVRLE